MRLPKKVVEDVLNLLGPKPDRCDDISVTVALSPPSKGLLARAVHESESKTKESVDEWDLLEATARETEGLVWIGLQHLIRSPGSNARL